MTVRGIVARSTLVEFLKDGIQNPNIRDLTTICIGVSMDIGATELRPFIDDAFRENRVELDVITQNDIIFHSVQPDMYSYLDPIQFFEPITVECFTQNRCKNCVTVLRSLFGDKMGPDIIMSETGIADAIKDQHLTSNEHDEKKSPEMKRIGSR